MAARIVLQVFLFLILLFDSVPVFALLPYTASDTAVPVERGRSRLDLSITHDRMDTKPRASRFSLRAELSYGLINNLDFSVDFPYYFLRGKEIENEDGLGDLELKAKIRFIKGREANPVSIAGQMAVKFPSCDEKKGLSPKCTGEPDVSVRAIASKEFFPVTVHLNLGFIFVGNPPNSSLDDVLTYSVAFDYLTVFEQLHVVGELAGETNRDPNTSEDPLSFLIGMIFDLDLDKMVSLTGTIGLTDASPEYGVSLGFRYLF